jgi:hypothetical protein
LPQRSKNELFRRAGEEFGFETYEVDGVRYMLATELSLRVCQHTHTSGLRKLLARYGHPLISLRSVGHDVALFLKQSFKLPPKSIWTILATWDHFAIAAMKSETLMAHEIQAYLLDTGVAAAANVITDGRHDEVLGTSVAHAQGVPALPMRRIVPLDLSKPQP